jgi:hypothetical protein
LELTGYFFGSSMASTIHAQPLWGMGFLSAFLTIWIFMSWSSLLVVGFAYHRRRAHSAQVLDRHVHEPGAQGALFLVRFFPVVLHDCSPSSIE